jgi:hypothetical protein
VKFLYSVSKDIYKHMMPINKIANEIKALICVELLSIDTSEEDISLDEEDEGREVDPVVEAEVLVEVL